ncbi:MAG: preprotein translocase subunit SecE [Phycisphaerae bacterium]|nr:preprotein translocase subunit SecE [Phycisphaerae bacterium]
MIATEGEMKKVSWSSKKEIIGSTKVVIVTLLIMGLVLFLVDLFFMRLMKFLNVQQF